MVHYICCFVYTCKEELEEWAKDNNADIQELNVTKYTPAVYPKLYEKFNPPLIYIHALENVKKCGYVGVKWETYNPLKRHKYNCYGNTRNIR